MTLEALQAEMVAAWKNNDKQRKNVLAELVGAVKKAGIDNKCKDDIPEDLVDQVLLKEKKMIQEMIDTCPEDRPQTLEAYQIKMVIVSEYAPQLLTDPEAIKAQILQILDEQNLEINKKNRGLIMRAIMPTFKGKADMAIVNKIVSELFA